MDCWINDASNCPDIANHEACETEGLAAIRKQAKLPQFLAVVRKKGNFCWRGESRIMADQTAQCSIGFGRNVEYISRLDRSAAKWQPGGIAERQLKRA